RMLVNKRPSQVYFALDISLWAHPEQGTKAKGVTYALSLVLFYVGSIYLTRRFDVRVDSNVMQVEK
ncbi:MAG: hypothetical protein ACRD4E_01990, partial [Bryobacteraceae bacterium]